MLFGINLIELPKIPAKYWQFDRCRRNVDVRVGDARRTDMGIKTLFRFFGK